MGINSFVKELWTWNMLKKKGYSLVEIENSDANVTTYIMKLKGKKSIKIGKDTFPINPNKKLTKGGVSLYRFRSGSAIGEDKNGRYIKDNMDSQLLTEIVRNATMVGQNSAGTDKKEMLLYIALGAIAGLAGGVMVAGFL